MRVYFGKSLFQWSIHLVIELGTEWRFLTSMNFGEQDWPGNGSIIKKNRTTIPREWIVWKDQNQWACITKMVTTAVHLSNESIYWKTRRVECLPNAIGKTNLPSTAQHSNWESIFGFRVSKPSELATWKQLRITCISSKYNKPGIPFSNFIQWLPLSFSWSCCSCYHGIQENCQ